MLLTYYTLRALAAEWHAALVGCMVADAYSQNRAELSIALVGEEESTLVVVARPELRLLFRNPGTGRARRNSASLFEAAHGQRVEAIRTADRDRFVFVELEGGLSFQVQLFGPRPNVFLVEEDRVVEAFQEGEDWAGESAPAPRAAPAVETLAAFEARWNDGRKTLAQAVAGAIPLFDRSLADEAVARSGIAAESPADASTGDRAVLFEAVQSLQADLAEPHPHVLWRGTRAEAFSLVMPHELDGRRAETFETVDEATRIYARRSLAQERFDALYRPLEKRLAAATRKLRRSADRMFEELGQPSRADGYERFGHLLMAQATGEPPGHESVDLPDLLGDGESVTIPLDPALSGVENAERYYDKARRTRAARAHAETRWEAVDADAGVAEALLERLRAHNTLADLQSFLDAEKGAIADVVGREGTGEETEPFRRFPLPGGWEAWVGKNARGNAALTTRHAQPHDLWLHARGVPGSHVVVRRHGKAETVEPRAIEAAAVLAAWFSDAKTQSLAPVTVTERKYVRPIKGGPPGLVRVDREDVVLVEPKGPG